LTIFLEGCGFAFVSTLFLLWLRPAPKVAEPKTEVAE